MTAIRYNDRIGLWGTTGCGKSTLARQLFMAGQAPRLVIDPADSTLTDVPGAVTVHGPQERGWSDDQVYDLVTAALNRNADADTLRFVPGVQGRRVEIDAVYGWAFDHFPRRVWLDEAGLAAPASGTPAMVNTLVTQGRKRQIGHMAAHTRPVDVAVSLIALGEHQFIWALPHADDRKRVAANIGMDWRQLSDLLDGLQRVPGSPSATGFLWWQQRERSLTVCPPLKVSGPASV